MISKKLIHPARLHNETFADYKSRRALANSTIKAHLRGKLIWEASKIVTVGLNSEGYIVGNPLEEVARAVSIKRPIRGPLVYPFPRKVGRHSRAHRAAMLAQELSK